MFSSSRKYGKVAGDSSITESESAWRKRKPTHLPPLTTPSPPPSPPPPDCYTSLTTFHRRGSVLSIAPSIVSNAPSTASGFSTSDTPFDPHAKLEILRRRLGEEVPASAAFHHPATCRTTMPRTPRTATPTSSLAPKRSGRRRTRSPHPSRNRQLHGDVHPPPVPSRPLPPCSPHASSSMSRDEDESAGLVRPRQKMAVGSRIGGADFKAARRAKREGRAFGGMVELGEAFEMIGFL